METAAVALVVSLAMFYLVRREVMRQRRMRAIPAGSSVTGCPGCCDGCALKRESKGGCHEMQEP